MAALTFVSRNEDQADTNSYSIASQPSGTAGARRFVAVWGRKNSAGDGIPATCSIGGEALGPVANSEIVGNVSTDNAKFGLRWFAGSPSVGGNQTIAFTFTADGGGGAAATMIRAGFAIYEADGLSATPFDTIVDEATANNDRTLTGTIDVAQGGAVVGFGVISSTANIACTLTGLGTEDFDIQESSANNNLCGGHENSLASETGRTITFTWAAGGSTDDACISVLSLQVDTVALTANNIAAGSPTVGTPALSQAHALDANDVASGAPTCGTPAIGQRHALAAENLATGAPSVGAPALTQAHVLGATGIAAGAPSVGAPALAQAHALTAGSISAGSPSTGAPSIAQRHALATPGVAAGSPTTGAPVFHSPALEFTPGPDRIIAAVHTPRRTAVVAQDRRSIAQHTPRRAIAAHAERRATAVHAPRLAIVPAEDRSS